MSAKQSRRDFMRWYMDAPKVVRVGDFVFQTGGTINMLDISKTIDRCLAEHERAEKQAWIREQLGMGLPRFKVVRKS